MAHKPRDHGVIAERVPLAVVCRRTGIGYSTLRQWISQGRLPASKAPNGKVYVLASDVESLFVPCVSD